MELEEIDRLYRSILGPFPERVPLNVEFLSEEKCDGFTRSLIAWDNEESERVVAMRLMAEGRCMAGQYVFDAIRQCDVLQSLDDVDGDRIGATGVSMGSGHTWLSAMVEPRIRALVGVSSFYTYKALYAPPIKHCFMNHLPNVIKLGLETYDLFRLIAPRPFLMINGTTEPQDPVAATQELYDKARLAWVEVGAGDDFQLIFHEAGHGFTPETRETAFDWLADRLGAQTI